MKVSGKERSLLSLADSLVTWSGQYTENCFHTSLGTVRWGSNSNCIVFTFIIQNSSWGAGCEIALEWMPQNLTNKKSAVVQVMCWCSQAPSQKYCWPIMPLPDVFTRPQWLKSWQDQSFSWSEEILQLIPLADTLSAWYLKIHSKNWTKCAIISCINICPLNEPWQWFFTYILCNSCLCIIW